VCDDKCSMTVCDRCRDQLGEFYRFKMRSDEVLRIQNEFNSVSQSKLCELSDHIEDKLVCNTVQIVRSFISRHSIADIRVDDSEAKLVITPRPKTASASVNAFQESISIKTEPDIKLEPIDIQIKEEPDSTLLDFIRSFGDSSEELTNSSEGSLSRLPAFEATTYFNGDKFVLRSEVPPKKLKETKKRQRKPELWATNIQKKLRNAGQRYRSSKGYIVEARSMAGPCNCRQLCATKVSEKNRLMNFSNYWSLDDIGKKRKFIVDHIRLERPMRAMTKSRALSRLILHFLDVMNSDGTIEQTKVCKTMFLNTLDISNTVIVTTVKSNHQYFESIEGKICKA
jgi:hypothetical protein